MSDVLDAPANPDTPAPATPAAGGDPPPAPPAPASPPPPANAPLAAGGKPAAPEAPKPAWPDDWRDRMAAQVGGTDAKAVAKERKRLERFTDPTAVYGSYRELDGKFSEGGLVKIPGKDAKPEDIQAFHKALGVPEKPEAYLENLQLEEGKVLGDADKPVFAEFSKAAHAAGMTPGQVAAAVNFQLQQQGKAAEEQYNKDMDFRAKEEASLKEEWGASFKANTNAIATLFASAPGGVNLDDDNSLMAQILGARLKNGAILGDDSRATKWLAAIAKEINPTATIIPAGSNDIGKSLNDEIASIETMMRTDRAKYNKDEAIQARYRELVTAREKLQARATA